MKKKILTLMLGFLLIGVNAFAAGDLIVDGKVGIGTNEPITTLHIKSDTPAIFMDDTDDMAYWLFGVTGGAFQIIKTNSVGGMLRQYLYMGGKDFELNPNMGDVDVWWGTNTQLYAFHADPTTEMWQWIDNIKLVLGTGKDVVIDYDSGNNSLDIDLATNGVNTGLRILTDGSDIVVDGSTGNVGIGTTNPNYPLEMASGAHVTAGGAWTNGSSREYKENIRDLTIKEAMIALKGLRPTRFSYKIDKEDEYLGFIAEDVPELVASKNRKGLSPMDIVTVLTKVVQQQQRELDELKARLSERQQ